VLLWLQWLLDGYRAAAVCVVVFDNLK